MNTQFKWNAAQRLKMISGLAMSISLCIDLEHAKSISEDMFLFSMATPSVINEDKTIQYKLKIMSEIAPHVIESIRKLETVDDDSLSFSE